MVRAQVDAFAKRVRDPNNKGFILDIAICLLLLLFAPLFFYKLGQSSLQNWDEAWYAEISRNIVMTGDLFNLTWAKAPYYDHPVLGFWLTAISFKFLGVTEFSARFMSALFGLFSIVIIYLLGKELFNRIVGFFAALALPSATWFLYRARSGNLDIYLETLFLLTLFLAFKANKDKRWLAPFTLSLSALFLTKTTVPFTILPAIIVIFWGNKSITKRDVQLNSMLFIFVVGSWVTNQLVHQRGFLERYFNVGLPGVQVNSNLLENFKIAKEYLHEGVGKWFWPGIFSLFLSLPLRQKRFLVLTVFFLSFFIPFLFSKDGGIWHLIPLHPILILAFFGFLYTVLKGIVKQKFLIALVILLICAPFAYIQIKRSWYEFININPYMADEAILSKRAAGYPEKLYIEGSDFRPVAVFYSHKDVPQRIYQGNLLKLFNSKEDFLMITYPRELQSVGIPKSSYKVIQSDRDKILLLKE